MARKGHVEACAFPASEEQGLIYVHYYINITLHYKRWPGAKKSRSSRRSSRSGSGSETASSIELN